MNIGALILFIVVMTLIMFIIRYITSYVISKIENKVTKYKNTKKPVKSTKLADYHKNNSNN
ncbi:MAG: hypothetical protein FWC68_00115 [Oscillospiraceae bacterium]|nr:hypothetical protein [Oscillospiraceae bacterium]